jgi:hypothetical protein
MRPSSHANNHTYVSCSCGKCRHQVSLKQVLVTFVFSFLSFLLSFFPSFLLSFFLSFLRAFVFACRVIDLSESKSHLKLVDEMRPGNRMQSRRRSLTNHNSERCEPLRSVTKSIFIRHHLVCQKPYLIILESPCG